MMRTTEKTKAPKLAGVNEKSANYVIDPETGKKISRTMYGILQYWKKPGKTAILDMRAVLK